MTIGLSICNTVLIYSPSVPKEWHGLLMQANFTIASIMACRIFRELKLGLYAQPMTDGTISKIVFRDLGTLPPQQSADSDDVAMDTGDAREVLDIENPAGGRVVFEEDRPTRLSK